ncbi:MAG: hypothetical protein KF858_08245 [Candidatus Sumerlaeia bacterium]|nr:hypothetical protein [Candidatus Sumerlaeia bacterium]
MSRIPHRSILSCALAALAILLTSCVARPVPLDLNGFEPRGPFRERTRVLALQPGVTATLVTPEELDGRRRIDLILYALPNGNTTAETMGRRLGEGIGWRHDIQHIAAQTRALRARGIDQAVVAYLEADTKSWPAWRRNLGYETANPRIVAIVDEIRAALGNPPHLAVTLTGHSGGGSFAWGFLDGQEALPEWLDRIAFLDSNYSFEPSHGDKIATWLEGNRRRVLVVLGYDDREITLDGKKVVSDTGGTWRATHRMLDSLRPRYPLSEDTLNGFIRFRHPQIEILLHLNPENKILHTAMIGEMNGYMHALLARRPEYERGKSVLGAPRVYEAWIEGDVEAPTVAAIPTRAPDALTGSAFIDSIADLPRQEREAAVERELLAGNIPDFLRRLRPITAEAVGIDGVARTVVYEVMPDYLAIGSDEDFVRMPMNPYTAQAFCDAFGFVMPTRKMVNDIWAAAEVHVDPRPLTEERDATRTFHQHHRIIEEQLDGQPRGVFVAGTKKDVVVSNRVQERPNRVAIYGWHYRDGKPIQPLTIVHVDWYVDYSHGIRPVRRMMRVDGAEMSYEAILSDPHRSNLLSDEGEIGVARY